MVKKLKGWNTEELKGEKKRKRMREYEKAAQFWKKVAPFVILIVILLMTYFTYRIYK